MKRALILLWLLAAPAYAQQEVPRSFDAVMEALDTAMQAGETEAPFVVLNSAIRTARAEGRLTGDWSLFFAMMADFVRNERGNPAFALALTEEGLALIAGDPSQADFAAILRVSGAYALADLGRTDEAARQASLVMPAYREAFGEDAAAELESYVALWAEGRLSDFNTAATDLARDALSRAREQAAAGAHGRAIATAGGALLPDTATLPPAQLRAINAEAEHLIAGSLRALGRIQDAGNAYLRAISHLSRSPWHPAGPAPDWWPEAAEPEGAALLFDAFQQLAALFIATDNTDAAIAALAQAESFATTPDDAVTLLLYQAVLANRDGDTARALSIIADSRDRAEANGETSTVLMADFYAAQVGALAQQRAGEMADPAPLIASAEAAIAHARATGEISEMTVLGDLAGHLSRTEARDAALDAARRALALRRESIDRQGSGDSAFGRDQARQAQRGAVELFLRTAHNAATARDPGCDDPAIDTYYGCVTGIQPAEGLR